MAPPSRDVEPPRRPGLAWTRARRAAGLALGLALAAAPAAAHPLSEHVAGTRWAFEPGALVGIVALAAAYAAGVRHVWSRAGRGRGVGRAQAAAFCAGGAALLLALASPLDAWAADLFSAHMTQHLLLVLVAAPLLVLGNVALALAWAPPPRWRRAGARWWHAPRAGRAALRAVAHAAATPAAAWLLHAIALVAWHAPALYDAALTSAPVHALEHACFLGTALLFWWRVLQPTGRRALGHGAAVFYTTAMALVGSALGALLTFSSRPWYPLHAAGARAWHVTLLGDQRLAGLLMWVPSGLVYLAAALAEAGRWLESADGGVARRRARAGRGVLAGYRNV